MWPPVSVRPYRLGQNASLQDFCSAYRGAFDGLRTHDKQLGSSLKGLRLWFGIPYVTKSRKVSYHQEPQH